MTRTTSHPSRLLADQDSFRVGKQLPTFIAVLSAHAGLLVTTERDVHALRVDLVDPDHAGFETVRNGHRSLGVAPPYRAAQSVDAGIGARDGIFDVVIGE